MSDLLNQASLVMIPSGYKEDTVYSVVPSDGSGDLAFTRASNGTRINSAGLVEDVPWNLLQYSEDFSNASWVKNNCSISSNAIIAPNGTTTADKLVEDTSTSIHRISQAPGSINGVFSAYAKAGERTKVAINTSPVDVGFDLSNGTVIDLGFGTSGTSIESVGNGWYRISLYLGVANSTYFLGLLNSSNQQDYTGDGTSGAYFYGAQLNIGSTAKPYFPTTDRLNVPRLTYQNGGGGCPSLLLEKQSTNLVTYSEQFDNAGWTQYQGATITANSVTSPDGTQNADTLTVASGQTYSGIYQSVSASSDVYTVSIFAKYNTKKWLFFFDASASAQGWFDIQNGVLGTIPSGHTGTIENFGNGWYRCTFKKNTAVTPAYFQIGLVDTDGFSSPTSNGSSYIWGAQLEASSYPTSYIVSTSSSATRVADACFKTGISSLIGQTEGTILLDWVQNAFNDSQGIYANNYNLTGSISIQISTNGTLSAYVCYGGIFFAITTSSNAIQVGQRYKIGLAYKSGDCVLYVNGNLIGTNTTSFAFTTTLSEIDLSNRTVFFSNLSEISVNELVQIKTRISNADIQSWTA